MHGAQVTMRPASVSPGAGRRHPEQADSSAGPELAALQAERAAILGMTEGSVRVAQHGALTALRLQLGDAA